MDGIWPPVSRSDRIIEARHKICHWQSRRRAIRWQTGPLCIWGQPELSSSSARRGFINNGGKCQQQNSSSWWQSLNDLGLRSIKELHCFAQPANPASGFIHFPVMLFLLEILLKQNTALLSTVCVCVRVYTVQVWHLKLSQLFDNLGHKNHIFSSSWQPWPLWFEIWWPYSKLFVSSGLKIFESFGLVLWIWVCWTQEGVFVAFISAFADFQKLFCSHSFVRFQKKSRLRKKTNV